jgi:hypothetical protein
MTVAPGYINPATGDAFSRGMNGGGIGPSPEDILLVRDFILYGSIDQSLPNFL